MKKIYFSLMALAVLACTSACVREQLATPGNDEKTITISASIDEGTKSTYTDEGVFSWEVGDEISYVLQHTDGYYNMNTLTTSGSGSKATFSGSTSASNYSAVDLAFYPKVRYQQDGDSRNTMSVNTNQNVKTLQAVLQGTVTARADRTSRIIPMIGKKVGEDAAGTVENYHFYPVTGVLKVSFDNLPATATQIRLDMPDNSTYALNGTFNVDRTRSPLEIKESDCVGDKWGQKYINFTYSSASDAFYFPIPTGTIPAGKLTVSVTDGTNTLYSVTNKVDITLTRGEITELPTISVPSLKVKISGTADAPKATFYFSGNVSKVRYYVDSQYSQVYDTDTEASSGVTISLPSSNSGKFFLNYVGYDSNGTPNYGTKESPKFVNYYALASSEASAIAGTYKFQSLYSLAAFNRSSWVNLTETTDNRMVIAISDNPEKGSLMITDLYGFRSDGQVTNESLTNANGNSPFNPTNTDGVVTGYMQKGLFSSGMPVYGWFKTADAKIYFENTTANDFFKYDNAGYVLRNATSSETGFSLTYNASSTPVTVTCDARICIVPTSYTGNIDGAKSLLFTSCSASNDPAIVGKKQ